MRIQTFVMCLSYCDYHIEKWKEKHPLNSRSMLRRLSKLLEFIMKTCKHSWNKTKLMSHSWIWDSEQRSNTKQMLVRVVPNRKCAILVLKNKSRDNVGTLTPWRNALMFVSCFLSSGKPWDGYAYHVLTCVVYSSIHVFIASNQFTYIKKT